MTAKQRVYQYFIDNNKYPDLETWKSWGYARQYYYEVRKKWESGESFNEPDNKRDKMMLEGLKMIANKDGVIQICKAKVPDVERLKDWLTFIRKDDEYYYYIVNYNWRD